MNQMKSLRRRMLIDRPVQLGLVKRIVLQWMTFLAAVVVVLPLYRAILVGDFATPFSQRLTQAGIEAAILFTLFAALLPYFIYDTFRLTNRFAGPMYRLHQTIRALAGGASAPRLNFRDGDYWQDVAQDFNAMVKRLQQDSPQAADETGDQAEQREAAAV